MKTQSPDPCDATLGLTETSLADEGRAYEKTPGVSEMNRSLGFIPAFYDRVSGRVARSCYANGQPAPFHMLDGVPAELVAERDRQGRVVRLKPSVVSGFLMADTFYTREQARRALSH